MLQPTCLIADNSALARSYPDDASEPWLWQQVAATKRPRFPKWRARGPARFDTVQNFQREPAPDPATVERNVIFARRRGIVVAACNGANAVVREDVPARGPAVSVPARVVNQLETNGYVLLARAAARFENGRTLACVHAAPLH